jgi:hypothetical protein
MWTPEQAREMGKRKGGRPKGRKNRRTIEREQAKREMDARTFNNIHPLYDAKMTLALGQKFLYRIDKKWIQKGKSGYWVDKPAVIVTDPQEIAEYLDGLLNKGGDGASYHYITTKEPSIQAIDSLMDSAFGKPKTEDFTAMPAWMVPVIVMEGPARPATAIRGLESDQYSVTIPTYDGSDTNQTTREDDTPAS